MMRLTRERKIILSVLTVAVLGLLVDRLFLSSPGTGPGVAAADAPAPAPASSAVVGTSPTVAVQADAPRSDSTSVAQLLESIRQPGELASADVADAFRPSSAWKSTQGLADIKAPEELPRRTGEEFAREHSLSGVMRSDDGGYAVINGQVVRLGQTVDGFELSAMSDNAVVMASGAVRVVLKLEGSSAQVDAEQPSTTESQRGPEPANDR